MDQTDRTVILKGLLTVTRQLDGYAMQLMKAHNPILAARLENAATEVHNIRRVILSQDSKVVS